MTTSEETIALLESHQKRPNFIVGLDLYLDLVHQYKKVRCKVNVHGWYHDDFFIVDAPMINAQEVELRTNEFVTVRFILDGVVYAFNTTLLRKVVAPTRLWLLSYPTIMETKTLRKHSRLQTLIPVSIDGFEEKALIIDLSSGGALVDCANWQSLPDLQEIKMSFNLPNGKEVLDLPAQVKNIIKNESIKQFGVSFSSSENEQGRAIKEFIDALPNRPPSPCHQQQV